MRDAIRACTPSIITVTSVHSEHNHREEKQ
jgi:hypothetical protein